jgi:hypothetical protein
MTQNIYSVCVEDLPEQDDKDCRPRLNTNVDSPCRGYRNSLPLIKNRGVAMSINTHPYPGPQGPFNPRPLPPPQPKRW